MDLLQGTLIEFIGANSRVLVEHKDEKVFQNVETSKLVPMPEVLLLVPCTIIPLATTRV